MMPEQEVRLEAPVGAGEAPDLELRVESDHRYVPPLHDRFGQDALPSLSMSVERKVMAAWELLVAVACLSFVVATVGVLLWGFADMIVP